MRRPHSELYCVLSKTASAFESKVFTCVVPEGATSKKDPHSTSTPTHLNLKRRLRRRCRFKAASESATGTGVTRPRKVKDKKKNLKKGQPGVRLCFSNYPANVDSNAPNVS